MFLVGDKIGPGFGCDTMPLFFTQLQPPPAPSSTPHLHQREKEAYSLLPFHQAMLRTEKAQDLVELAVEEVEKKKCFSETSSGCQSGWTLYLGHSQSQSIPTTSFPPPRRDASALEDEEDDLSMLSDASSGPPNINQADYFDFCYCSNGGDDCLASFAGNGAKRSRVEKVPSQKQSRDQEHPFFLEDTASSPLLCFSKNTSSSKRLKAEDLLEHSCGFSANHFKKKMNCLHSSAQLNSEPVCRQEGEKDQP